MNGPQQDAGWFATNLHHLSDVVLVVGPDTTILWANDTLELMLGWSPADVVGRSFAEYLHPDDLDRAAEVASLVDQDVFVEEAVKPALYRVRHGEGHWVTVELNSSLRAADQGEIIVVVRLTGDLVHGSRLLQAITSGSPLAVQLRIVLDLGRWRYPNEGYSIYHRTPEGYVGVPAPGMSSEVLELGLREQRPWREAIDRGQTWVDLPDLADPEVWKGHLSAELAEAAVAAGYRGCLTVPVVDEGYEDGAAIVVWSRKAGSSLVGHRYAVSTMQQALTLVLQQQAQRLKLEQAAYTDHLTGLMSRRRFLDLLQEADEQRAGSPHVAMYVDLDSFKRVNDDLGHRIGDHVLAVAARRIAAALPSGTLVGRLGGDEFGVLCAEGTTPEQAAQLAAAVEEATTEPIAHEQGRTVVGATIGVYVGEVGQRAIDVLDAADRVLMDAKASTGGRSRADGD